MRVGLIVPLFKHSAVARNQLKRRLRELVRLNLLPTGLHQDVVLRIRPHAYGATFAMLSIDVHRSLSELQRWQGRISTPGGSGAAGEDLNIATPDTRIGPT
jgi:ribonuclease P protein component